MLDTPDPNREHVDFWNEILEPKLARKPSVADPRSRRRMKAELAPFATEEGIVMPSSFWRISARNPG